MAKQSKKSTAGETETAPSINLIALVPLFLFVVICIMFFSIAIGQKNQAQKDVKKIQELNTSLGLPLDYPHDLIPLYAGVTVLETTKDKGMSTEGGVMDVWVIHTQIDSDREPIFDYYHNLMMEQGMSQTQFISVPATDGSGVNIAANYADETHIVEFTLEKTSQDTMTQLIITVSRLR